MNLAKMVLENPRTVSAFVVGIFTIHTAFSEYTRIKYQEERYAHEVHMLELKNAHEKYIVENSKKWRE